MELLLLYWGMIIVGYFVGVKFRQIKTKLSWISKLLFVAIAALVFLMGVRMGSNQQVVSNLGTIGLKALFMTIVIMAGSILAVKGTRKLFRIDRFGKPVNTLPNNNDSIEVESSVEELKDNIPASQEGGGSSMTLIILAVIIIGMLSGYFLVPRLFPSIEYFELLTSNILVVGLCLLLFLVGIDLGLSGSVFSNFKSAGFRVLVFPVAVVFGSLFAAFLCSFVLPISGKEALAIGAGFGWYTLAPIVISEQGYEIAGAISFMHNVMREFGGIILIPVVAEKIGYIEAAGMPGVAAMDICIPIVEKSCGERIVIYSFLIGMLQSALVPLLVPLIIGS